MAKLCRAMLVLAGSLAAAGLAAAGLHYPFLALLVVGASAWRRMRVWRFSGAHGTARIASLFELMRAGMLRQAGGLILGRASLVDPPTRAQAIRCLLSPRVSSATACRMAFAAFGRRADAGLVRVPDLVHAVTVAPSGAGKSTAVLVPNLRSYRGSCVVIDPKGELFKLTAETRQRAFGHRIVRLDPFGVAGDATTSDALNFCDFVDERGLGFYDDCRALADLLVMQRGTTDPHWDSRSIDVLTTFIVFVCALEADPAKRNLLIVRDLLAAPHRFREVLAAMQATPGFEGLLALLGDSLQWLQDRELGSVLSTVSRHIAWLFSPAVSEAIGRSTFDPRMLWSGKMTVYICLPSDKLTILAPLMRIWLGCLLTLVSRNGGTDKYPVLFLVDEAATLGKMQPIQDAFGLLRGYGVKIWLFLQSLEQLKQCYGEAASIILDNAGTQQYFGITSFETGDQLSKRIGDATVLVESINRNSSRSRSAGNAGPDSAGSVTTGEGVTISEHGRRLIRPEEVLVLPRDVGLVFHKNLPVIPVRLAQYYSAPEFARGGTGQGRRLGLPALAASAFALLAGAVCAAFLLALPYQQVPRPATFAPAPRGLPAGRPTSGVRPLPRLSDPANWRRAPGPAAAPTPAPGWSFDDGSLPRPAGYRAPAPPPRPARRIRAPAPPPPRGGVPDPPLGTTNLPKGYRWPPTRGRP